MKTRFSRLAWLLPVAVLGGLASTASAQNVHFLGGVMFSAQLRDSDPLCQGKNCWLRQRVGGLIGTKSDHAIIVILDNRIVTKPHGRAFLQALPSCPMEII